MLDFPQGTSTSEKILARLSLVALMATSVSGEASAVAFPESPTYVLYAVPELLSYPELVELLRADEPRTDLKAKLNRLLTTPFLSNEAHYRGVTPHRPSSPTLGPFLRVCLWNIERGLRLEEIKSV